MRGSGRGLRMSWARRPKLQTASASTRIDWTRSWVTEVGAMVASRRPLATRIHLAPTTTLWPQRNSAGSSRKAGYATFTGEPPNFDQHRGRSSGGASRGGGIKISLNHVSNSVSEALWNVLGLLDKWPQRAWRIHFRINSDSQ